MSTNPFAATLLNNDGALKPKPVVDVRPRAVSMATPYCSQIDAPSGNYIQAADIRPADTSCATAPCAPQIASERVVPYQQPDTLSKPQVGDAGANPVYLELVKRDELGPAANPTSVYIPSGSSPTDPTIQLSPPQCPIDNSPLKVVGSSRGMWICAGGHQWDVTDGFAATYFPTNNNVLNIPPGGPLGANTGVENL
jgi:hypothetical protein